MIQEWLDSCHYHSNHELALRTPEAQAILAQGDAAITPLLEFYQHNSVFFIGAMLQRITGANVTAGQTPVAPGWYGTDVRAYRDGWLHWGRDNGYIQ